MPPQELPPREITWHDAETELGTTDFDSSASPDATSVPGLTILAHPDRLRIGERLALPALAAGGELRLSRLEPVFRQPGQDVARPLADRRISRRPIRLLPGEEPGAVTLDVGETRTALIADGVPVIDRRTFSAAEIEHGVVLLLGRRIVLLLGSMTPEPRMPSPDFGLLGESAGIVRLRREILRLAGLDAPVLLLGETGTGKELTARALHDAGPRGERPFVAVNLGALPPTLAAAELFGAERGAYTGAERAKQGLFEHARGGTLFLDEIGECPPEVQVMLLRTLETGEIRPMGSAATRPAEVRVVAATDADLSAAITAGRFRAPLYHRLAGCSIRLPPLRARREDIGRLLDAFLTRELDDTTTISSEGDSPWPPAAIVGRLAAYDWPGNVRELRNVARRLAILGRRAAPAEIHAEIDTLLAPAVGRESPRKSSVPPTPADSPAGNAPPVDADESAVLPVPARRRLRKIEDVSEAELLEALEANHFKLQPTAQALGLSPVNLYRLIDQCPSVRKAADLERDEIVEAVASCPKDLEAAAARLRVSLQGLKRRMTALGLTRR